MKAVVMAGGFGTRLRPLSINIPKPMVPIGTVPMMEHVVRLLASHGLTDVTSLLYFQADKIKEHFGDGKKFGVDMSYALPDDDYGTAGAVRKALSNIDEPVLIISGDVVTNFDLTEAIKWHQEKKSDASILLTRAENPLAYGIVITNDEGRIERFLEKPSWGEAFSDTINTGIYILEPQAVSMIPDGQNFDFSQDLYPQMLAKDMGLYGKIMEGYWKDVGNVDEYRLAHRDIFTDTIKLTFQLKKSKADDAIVLQGKNVQVAEGVRFEGMVILDDDVQVQAGSKLTNCSIGARARIGEQCELKDSVVWSDSRIGKFSTLESAIVCERTIIGETVTLLDNVIVSDEVLIGDEATVKANCKIWPAKTVDPGAIVSSSLVWGEKWNRELFTDSKLTGLALTEITPEMAVRLGAAFGATLGKGASVVTSRDASDISRLLRRTMMSGLLASGVNVFDLETMPVPIVRFALSRREYTAGIYVRHTPQDFRQLDFIFFDGNALDMPTGRLKKVERNYFGEDFDRATLDEIGHLDFPQRVLREYQSEFMNEIDEELIKSAGFKIVVDHSNGSSSQVFPSLFTHLGISTTELNANLNPRKFSISERERAQAIVQLSTIVSSLKADIGFRLNPAAEQLTVVDETGIPLDNQTLLLVVTDLFLRVHGAERIAVPVVASMGVEELAAEHGTEVIRVANHHRAMMDAHRSGDVQFVGGSRGGFIFPGFQIGADAILATVKILELIAKTRETISEIRKKYDKYQRHEVSIPCPWSRKGTVMRRLITETANIERQLIDGVRLKEDGGWVLVSPDRFRASFNIFAESGSVEQAQKLVEKYRDLVERWQAE